WEKGDGWGGGGLFDGNNALKLNHCGNEMSLREGDKAKLPKGFRIAALAGRPGWGEDDPIMSMRLARDGWRDLGGEKRHEHKFGAKIWITYEPAVTRTKTIVEGHRGKTLSLRMHCHGIHERHGRWYVESADVVDQSGAIVFDCGRTEWADLDHNGDVLFAREGRLYRLSPAAL